MSGMVLWENTRASKVTHGKSTGPWQAMRIEIDSRRIQPGDMFVAIEGEKHDGHKFLGEAFGRGAAVAMVDNALVYDPGQYLLVDDSLLALGRLAKEARNRSAAKVVGVTGSVGKTGTKDMLRVALSVHGKTHATSGNYNNHIGLPLSLANMWPDAEFAVFEMGMNHAGEIAHLTAMARPHVAIITTVEAVHAEFFPSVEAIADAKAEIFEGVVEGGIAVLNHHNKYFAQLEAAAKARNLRVISVGRDAGCDVKLLSAEHIIQADVAGKRVEYHLPVLGAHMVANSLLVLAAIHALGLDVQKSADALSAFEEPAGRGSVKQVSLVGLPVTVIDDSYNASPVSMRAAFAKTEEVWRRSGGIGRKIAVLGDMLELGEDAPSFHAGLAEGLSSFDVVFTVGSLMKHLHDALPIPQRGAHVAVANALLPELLKALKSHDIVLLKGSHGSHIHTIASSLLGTEEKKHAV
ncbi:MAG: UDP-N-acetylmuramoyl-tripeptide--D-alanyl-D-alanine ligase [Alphaproteobacteria bacterium]